MTRALSVAIGLARTWTRLYTSRLDPALRDARRAEIESDLWESHEDARHGGYPPAGVALQIMARLLLGMPHDLLWFVEHRRAQPWPFRRVALIGAAAAVFLAVFWVASALQDTPLPTPPPSMVFIAAPPPPPPPPPPPETVIGKDGGVVRPPFEPPRR